ncbi:phosphate-starvation-inducible protein PsiE [Staphylococcus equorum]|nr:phosphate-starvation-inducible protein PsiE [Staphylococcus equorum]
MNKVIDYFTKALYFCLNLCIAILGVILVVFLFQECWGMIYTFIENKNMKYNYVVEKMLIAFMHIEFILLIIQYFRKNYHFSLQFFIYVGITAVIRFIIVEHYNAIETLLLAVTIGVLIFCLHLLKRYSLD